MARPTDVVATPQIRGASLSWAPAGGQNVVAYEIGIPGPPGPAGPPGQQPGTIVPNTASNGRRVVGITTTDATATIVTGPAGSFTTAMVGRKAVVYNHLNRGTLRTVTAASGTTLSLDGACGLALPATAPGDSALGMVLVGTDDTAALQAALTTAGQSYIYHAAPDTVHPNQPTGGGGLQVVLPGNAYGDYTLITGTVTVPSGVTFDAQGDLFAHLSDLYAPAIHVKPQANIRHLRMDCNNGSGVLCGDRHQAVHSHATLGDIDLWRVGNGFDADQSFGQFGILLAGYDFALNRVWITGGNRGIFVEDGGDVICPSAFLIGCTTGLSLAGAAQVRFESVLWDTIWEVALSIDACSHVEVRGMAFINAPNAVQYIAQVGRYYWGVNNRGIDLDIKAQSTGGVGLLVANCEDFRANLTLSNAQVYTGVPITTAVQYGTGMTGFCDITVVKSPAIAASSGTVYGTLTVR